MSGNICALVTAKWLADTLRSSPRNLRVLDGSWHLPAANRNPRREYEAGHIPEALFFDIGDCSDPCASYCPHMLPSAAHFEAYVGKLGINNHTHVIVYDNHDSFPVFSAQRVWWTFRTFGHDKISVLEGGLRKWSSEGNPLSNATVRVPEEKFNASFRPSLVKSFSDIQANQFSKREFALVDARPSGRFEGSQPEPRPDIKPGHIPGSVNLPFPDTMDVEKQRFKNKEELQQLFNKLSVDLNQPMVATCGSGISACLVVLAAYVCGKEDVAVYDGSWTEWYQRAKPGQMENVPPN